MNRILATLAFLIGFQQAGAQVKNDSIPIYKRFPTVPPFTIMTAPDSAAFSKDDLQKKKAVVFVIFSPDCEHCKHFTKELLEKYDLVKKARIIMVSSLNFDLIKRFYQENKIADYSHIAMGRDGGYMLGTFFNVRSYPTVVVYDKKGKLVERLDGAVSIEKIAGDL